MGSAKAGLVKILIVYVFISVSLIFL